MPIRSKIYSLLFLLCLHHGTCYLTHSFPFEIARSPHLAHSAQSYKNIGSLGDVISFPGKRHTKLTPTAIDLIVPTNALLLTQHSWHQFYGRGRPNVNNVNCNSPTSTGYRKCQKSVNDSKKTACAGSVPAHNCKEIAGSSSSFNNEVPTHVINKMKHPKSRTFLSAPGNIIFSRLWSLPPPSPLTATHSVSQKRYSEPRFISEADFTLGLGFHALNQNSDITHIGEVPRIVNKKEDAEEGVHLIRNEALAADFGTQDWPNRANYGPTIRKRDGKRIPRGWGPYSVLYINRPHQNDILFKPELTAVPTTPPIAPVTKNYALKSSRQFHELAVEPKHLGLSAPRPSRPERSRITLPHLHAAYGWGTFGQ